MRKYICLCLGALAAFTIFIAACGIDAASSLKDITKPYIAQYECTSATLGGSDLLQQFDYIRITILDEEEFELAFKEKGKEKKAKTFGYNYDRDSGEFTAEGSVMGVKVKERTIIKDGAFTLNLPLGGRELILKFEKM